MTVARGVVGDDAVRCGAVRYLVVFDGGYSTEECSLELPTRKQSCLCNEPCAAVFNLIDRLSYCISL